MDLSEAAFTYFQKLQKFSVKLQDVTIDLSKAVCDLFKGFILIGQKRHVDLSEATSGILTNCI